MIKEWLAACIPKLETPNRRSFFRFIKEGKNTLTPTHVFDIIYTDLRICAYPPSARYTANIEDLTAQAVRGMEVQAEEKDGWHYRMPANRKVMGWSTRGKSVDRISLNVYPELELIKKLDEFCTQHKAYYKTPDELAKWENRHDPITIYFHEPVSADIQSQLKAIVTPHVRGGNLYGQKIAEGIYMEASPSVEDINALIKRADGLDPTLGTHVRKKARESDPSELKLSAGEKRAIEIALDDFQEFASNPINDVANSLKDICRVRSYNGKLSMAVVGTPEQVTQAHVLLVKAGLITGQDYFSRSDKAISVIGLNAQQLITDVCRAQGVDPSALAGRTAGS